MLLISILISVSLMFRYLLLLSVASTIFSTSVVFAQNAQPANISRDQDILQQKLKELENEKKQEFNKSQIIAPHGQSIDEVALENDKYEGCLEVKSVSIEGMTLLNKAEYLEKANKLVRNCTPLKDINSFLHEITNEFVSRGFITSRAFVDKRDINSGQLKIVVFEGVLLDVKAKGEKKYSQRQLALAFPNLKNSKFNLRDVEQGVDQLSRLKYAEPSIDIVAGPNTATSIVEVSQKPASKKIRPFVSINNQGSKSIGRLQSSYGIDFDNLFGLADAFSISYLENTNKRPNVGNTGLYGFISIPYGYWALNLSAGKSNYKTVFNAYDKAFTSSGDSWNSSLNLSRLLYRDSNSKLLASFDVSVNDTQNYIQSIKLASTSYRLASIGANLAFNKKIGNDFLALDIGYINGIKAFGAHSIYTGDEGPKIKSRIINLGGMFQKNFKIKNLSSSFVTMLHAQYGVDNLFPIQRFSLGGESNVRGFVDDGLSGRSGAFIREQLNIEFPKITPKNKGLETKLSGFIGYDYGTIFSNSFDAFERGDLSAFSVGLKAEHKNLQGVLTIATPLDAPFFVKYKNYEVTASIRVNF